LSTFLKTSDDARRLCGSAQNAQVGSGAGSAYCFGLRLLGFAIHVEAPSVALIALLERSVFPSVPRMSLGALYRDLSLRVTQSAGQFRLERNEEVVASVSHPDALLRCVIDCVDRAFIARVKNFRAVHAGAVLLGDRALLLPGASRAGKSSLVAELLRRGAACLSDEYALIDGAGMVHPYPRPLLLRNGREEQTPVLPSELHAGVAGSPAKVGWILSLRHESGGCWRVKGVPQSLALLSLLKNTPYALAESPGLVAVFERAVAGARCFEGIRGESAEAVDQILNLTR
jgi:hypothetical protein